MSDIDQPDHQRTGDLYVVPALGLTGVPETDLELTDSGEFVYVHHDDRLIPPVMRHKAFLQKTWERGILRPGR